MLKKNIVFVMFCFLLHGEALADSHMVKIIAVSKTSWKIETIEQRQEGASGGGAAAGAVGGVWIGSRCLNWESHGKKYCR